MSLKIEDIKPGDILIYREDWFVLVIRTDETLDYIWLSSNRQPKEFDDNSYRYRSSIISLKEILGGSIKLTHIDIHTLIGELEKLKNDNRTRPTSSS